MLTRDKKGGGTDTGIVRAGLSLLLPVLRGCQKLASNYTPVVVDTFSRHIYLLFHLLPDAYLSSPESVLLCHPMLVCRQFYHLYLLPAGSS